MSSHGDQDDQAQLRSLSVLYVEDEDEIREELAVFLRRRVATVHLAANGQAGLDAFTQYQPDLVITDIRMPVMNGFEMAERIRAMSPEIPIIITTAFEETSYFQKAIDLGVDKYVTKPLNLDILAAALRKCARLIRAEAALREVDERYPLLFQPSHRAISVAVADGRAVETRAVARDLSERAEHALQLAARVFESSGEAIVITDPDNLILSVNRAFSKLTGYSQEEVIGRDPRLLKSDRHEPTFYQELWKSLLAAGHWQGEIWNRRKNGEVYPEWLSITVVRDTQGQVLNYIAIFSDISEIKAAMQQIEFLAHYDPLTRLANRRLLEQRVEQLIALAARNKKQLALLFIDLDRFKVVNDSLGHAAGDVILETVAQRLRATMREVDCLARLGGDEFVCVLHDVIEPPDVHIAARRLMAALDEPIPVAGHTLTVTSSIGISLYPGDGVDYETLLKHADAAMYSAKKAGRDRFAFFCESMNVSMAREREIESALRRALSLDEFVLHYQPQVAIGSGRIIGMEALLRWNSAQLGPIAPGAFIPLAEETGLIVAIGEWVLREACRQNAQWQRAGLPAVVVAVNLSALQFRQSNLPETVRGALQASGLAARWLELELTESLIMQDAEYTIASLQVLKEIGTTLAIDDFGTGYSSLAYLKRFAIDKLKIDQSFIRDIPDDDDDKIVTAIIGLAHALNLKVIAEGVETDGQLAFLRERHCDEMQGYLYRRPLPAAAMEELLKADCSPVQ